MKMQWLPWIICFVAVDLAVTTLVIRRLLARRAQGGSPVASGAESSESAAGPAIPDIGRLREFTDAIHPRIGEIVQANWNGNPDSLPGALSLAIDEAEREARDRGLTLDRGLLKKLVETSLERHGVIKGSRLREALKKVA